MEELTIITHSPQGTLGDVTANAKIINDYLAKYPDIKINLLICSITGEDHWIKLHNVLPKHKNITKKYCYEDLSEKIISETIKYRSIVILSMTALFISEACHLFLLQQKKCRLIIITPYNPIRTLFFNPHTHDPKILEELHIQDQNIINKYQSQLKIFELGLGDNIYLPKGEPKSPRQGIYIDLTPQKINLDNINSNKALFNYLFDNKNKLKYTLFTCYFNKGVVQEDEFVKFLELYFYCILYNYNTKNPAAIIIPELAQSLQSKLFNQEILSQFSFDIVQLNQSQNTFEVTDQIGQGDTQIKLIYGFPLAHSSMLKVLELSEPLAIAAGDQSLSEMLSYDKIVMLQIIFWKQDLLLEFLKISFKSLGKSSLLIKFYKSLYLDYSRDDLLKTIKDNYQGLVKEAKILKQYIYDNHKLELTPKIHAAIENFKSKGAIMPIFTESSISKKLDLEECLITNYNLDDLNQLLSQKEYNINLQLKKLLDKYSLQEIFNQAIGAYQPQVLHYLFKASKDKINLFPQEATKFFWNYPLWADIYLHYTCNDCPRPNREI